MNVIVIGTGVVSLAALVCARYLWLWGTRDRRYEAAHDRLTRQFQQASRTRALTTETGLMPVISQAPVRGGSTPDARAAHGLHSTASSTTTSTGGCGGNAVVATDNAPSDAIVKRNVPAGEPVYRAAVSGAPGRSAHPFPSRPVLRAGGVAPSRRTASPSQPTPEAAAMRTPRSA